MRGFGSTLLLGLAALAFASGCRSTPAKAVQLPFQVALEFQGQETVAVERLTEVVREELGRLEVPQLDKAAVDDAAFALELFYQARGNAEALVDYDFESGDPPRATFRISEGPTTLIRELVLVGRDRFPLEQVRHHLAPVAKDRPYDRQQLTSSLAALLNAYHEDGFLRAQVDSLDADFDEDHTGVVLTITIQEGPLFRVKAVDMIGGVESVKASEVRLTKEYLKEEAGEVGRLYRPFLLKELEHSLGEAYGLRGYPDARISVRADIDESSGDVRLTVEANPGDLVVMARIRVEGNVRTKESAIVHAMGIELGSPYDAEAIREAFRDLYATGLFESVSVGIEGTGPDRTLFVEVVEARSVLVSIEPGWGSYEGPRLQLGIEENNFRGLGETLSLKGNVSPLAKAVRVAWVDRSFLGSHLTSETAFFVEEREEPSFEFVRRGFSFSLRQDWNDNWNTTAGYEFRPTDVTDDPTNAPDSDFEVGSVSAGAVFDSRDNLLLPTRGRQARARLEWADDGFASDTEFLRVQLEYLHLLPLGNDSVLAAGLRTGVISPFGITDELPVTELFFNGGENTVRSFLEDELLSDETTGESVGGEAATTLNLEYRHLLTGNLAGALFVDVGNVVPKAEDYLDFDDFRSGVGIGVRYQLPIGPVRLDLGFNPDPRDDEDDFVLHFSLGFPF